MNIKKILIHILGGLTVEESQDSDTNSFMIGQWSALQGAKTFAESLNGIPADDWCKTVYNHLCARIAEVEQQSAAIAPAPDGDRAPSSRKALDAPKRRNLSLHQSVG